MIIAEACEIFSISQQIDLKFHLERYMIDYHLNYKYFYYKFSIIFLSACGK